MEKFAKTVFIIMALAIDRLIRTILANGIETNKAMKIINGNINKHSIKVGSWNVNRGYLTKGKLYEVEDQMRMHGLDICALSEVDISDTAFHMDSLYDIDGYDFTLPNSWSKYRKSRSIVYVKKHLKEKMKIRKDLMSDTQPDIWLEIKIPGGDKLVIGSYYREFTGLDGNNSLESQKERLKKWMASVNKVEEEGKEILLIGDLNIEATSLFKNGGSSLADMMTECCNANGLDQLIKVKTRSRMVNGKLEESSIDHIYTNKKEMIRKIKLVELSSSDHKFVKCERMMKSGFTPKKITVRSYKKFDAIKFGEDLESCDWDDFWNEDDIDKATEQFTHLVKTTLDKHAPMVSFIPKNVFKRWIKPETQRLIAERDAAYKKCKFTKNQMDVDYWKSLRNKVVGNLRKDKKEMIEDGFTANNAWGIIKGVNNKMNGGPPSKLRIEGHVIKDKMKIAQEMNKHFEKKIEKIVDEIDKTEPEFCPIEHFKEKIQKPIQEFEFKEVSKEDIEKVIDKLKNSSGVGVDGLSNKILKTAKHIISKPLLRIINQAIVSETYPTSWKECTVIPLYKKKDPLEAKNYRPIHLLPKPSLVFEQLLLNQLQQHWKTTNLTSPSQHGYVPGRSCTTALAELYDKWTRAVDIGNWVSIFLTDQSSAFEIVSPTILLGKMESLNIKVGARNLILNYLTNRSQRTRIEDKLSDKTTKSIGVAPGSKIGPFLYSVLVMDLPETTDCDTVCYADDTSCTVVAKQPEEAVAKTENDAKKITSYMRANRLSLAEDKSTWLLAQNKQRVRTVATENLELQMSNCSVKQERTATVLGLKINNTLTHTDHLFGNPDDDEDEGLIRKLKKRLGIARKISYLPFKYRKMVVTGIFMGKLCYGLEIYGSAIKGQLKQLQQLQQRAARMVTKNPKTISNEETLQQCGWLDIESLIKQRTLNLGYNVRLNKNVPYLEKYVGRGRKALGDEIPQYETELGRLFGASTIPRFVKLWNDLPRSLRVSSPSTFKHRLRDHFKKEQRDKIELKQQQQQLQRL